jgi:hypothetical protein
MSQSRADISSHLAIHISDMDSTDMTDKTFNTNDSDGMLNQSYIIGEGDGMLGLLTTTESIGL